MPAAGVNETGSDTFLSPRGQTDDEIAIIEGN